MSLKFATSFVELYSSGRNPSVIPSEIQFGHFHPKHQWNFREQNWHMYCVKAVLVFSIQAHIKQFWLARLQ